MRSYVAVNHTIESGSENSLWGSLLYIFNDLEKMQRYLNKKVKWTTQTFLVGIEPRKI